MIRHYVLKPREREEGAMRETDAADLLGRLRYAPPEYDTECPILDPAPEGRLKYHVPPELRGILRAVVKERIALNTAARPTPGYSYYRRAVIIEREFDNLVRTLRTLNKLPDMFVVEFHEKWLFSVTTLETLRAEYEARPKPKREKEAASGISYAYLNEPPEVADLSHLLWWGKL